MRLSEFQRAMADEFGEDYASVLLRDHWLSALGGSARDALAEGIPPKRVWNALCDDLQVPAERRHGRGLIDPRE